MRKFALKSALFTGVLIMLYCILVATLEVVAPTRMDEWFRPKTSEPFVAANWKKSKFGDSIRYKMANDVVMSKTLINRTETDVKELLGDPSWIGTNGIGVMLNYELVPQSSQPAGCSLLPSNLFFNTETWLLEIQCIAGQVRGVRIRHT